MPMQNIVLTDRQERFVDELIASGRYQDASEVLSEALRLLEQGLARSQEDVQTIRSGLVESLDQEARGEFAEGTAAEGIRRAFSRRSSRQTA